MTPTGPLPVRPVLQVRDVLLNDAVLGVLAALGAAALLEGVLAGAVVLALVRVRGYSWAPLRLLAARLLRRPYGAVGRSTVLWLHFLVPTVVLFVVGAVYLGGAILLAALGLPNPPLLSGGLATVGLLLLLGGVGAWAVFAYRLLPANAAVVDRSVETLRRQSIAVVLAYAVVAGVVYPVVLFLAMMLVFFR